MLPIKFRLSRELLLRCIQGGALNQNFPCYRIRDSQSEHRRVRNLGASYKCSYRTSYRHNQSLLPDHLFLPSPYSLQQMSYGQKNLALHTKNAYVYQKPLVPFTVDAIPDSYYSCIRCYFDRAVQQLRSLRKLGDNLFCFHVQGRVDYTPMNCWGQA